jgi:hypothetical protein
VTPVFGAPPRLHLKLPATAWYAATFDVRVAPSKAILCLESEALSGHWALWLNGRAIGGDAWSPGRRWTVGLLEAEVAPFLQPGRNEVLIRVEATEEWDGLVDAIYFLGDFGLTYDPAGTPVLGERPTTVHWDDLFGPGNRSGGFPHYAGTFHLTRSVRLDPRAGEVTLRFPDETLMFAGVAQLSVNGKALPVRPWAPYAWTVPADALQPGPNEITLSITNTLVGQLEGQLYQPPRS